MKLKEQNCTTMADINQTMPFTFIDLFCGIGGFRIAAEASGGRCLFSCDIDKDAQGAYEANFGDKPAGDIKLIDAKSVPDHDVLFAGFPCQPFSIIGLMNGMDDARGTLFFEIARILEAKKPRWFVLENVKQLVGHKNGRTLAHIVKIVENLGYNVNWRVFNALDFGLPQKRERVYIVGSIDNTLFTWPSGSHSMTPLSQMLENNVAPKYFASAAMQLKRLSSHKSKVSPSIWHENKAGHISSYPYSCALRSNASYNYLLVNGVRRLTPREQLRLQGFPDWFKIVTSDSATRKQTGNAVAVPVVRAVIQQIIFAEQANQLYETKNKNKTARNTTLSFEPVPV